jgi:hypothetical protein
MRRYCWVKALILNPRHSINNSLKTKTSTFSERMTVQLLTH